jgi:hypothetical protein
MRKIGKPKKRKIFAAAGQTFQFARQGVKLCFAKQYFSREKNIRQRNSINYIFGNLKKNTTAISSSQVYV